MTHGYKELTIPAGLAAPPASTPDALHIWPRGCAMMIALPNADGSFTCTLFWPRHGDGGFEPFPPPSNRARTSPALPGRGPLMPNLVEDYEPTRSATLVTIRCWTWVGGRVALVGDAAHAIVPFYGQVRTRRSRTASNWSLP